MMETGETDRIKKVVVEVIGQFISYDTIRNKSILKRIRDRILFKIDNPCYIRKTQNLRL